MEESQLNNNFQKGKACIRNTFALLANILY